MKLKELFTSIYSIIVFLLVALCVVSVLMYLNNQKMVQSNITLTRSIQIADELRESSDNLTRDCRTYIETQDSIWENRYWEILDVRNGKKPRPDNGQMIALQDTMRKLGFTEDEFAKLKESEKNSNNLVRTETIAFYAVKGWFADSAGHFTIHKAPDIDMARSIMFEKKYLHNKSMILKPIDDFIVMVKQRTQGEVDKYTNYSDWFLGISVVLIFTISIISFGSYFIIKTKIIKQLAELNIAKNKAEKSEEFLKTQNDILDKKVAERTNDLKLKNEELSTSELKFRNLIEQTTDAIVTINESRTRFVDVNNATCKLLGYSYDEMLDLPISEIFFKEDIQQDPLSWDYIDNNNYLISERRLRRKDGTAIEMEFNTGLLKGVGYISIARDITERKRIRQQLQAIIDYSPENIVLLDIDFKIMSYNAVMKKTLTLYFNREIQLGDDYRDFVIESHKQIFLDSFAKAINGEEVNIELETKGDGFSIWFDYVMGPVYSQTGELLGTSLSAKDITERKKAEFTIKESEERYRYLFDNNPACIIIWDLENLKILQINDAVIQKYGYTKDEWANMTVLDYRPKELHTKIKEFAKEMLAGSEPSARMSWLHLNKNGEAMQMEITSHKINYENRKAILSLAIDVTEQKKAEQQLEESELKFRGLVEQSALGVYIIQNGKFSYVNPKLANIFGYEEEELINTINTTELVYKDDKEIVETSISAKEQGTLDSNHYEAKGAKKNGEIIWMEIYSKATLYNGAKAVIGTVLDITDRKNLELEKQTMLNALQQSEANLSSVFNNTNVGHLLLDKNFTITSFNQSYNRGIAKLFGNNLRPNVNYLDVIKPERRLLIEGYLNQILKDKKTIEYEASFEVNNEVQYFNVSIVPIEDKKEIIGFCFSAYDITKRKLMEVERQKIVDELIQRNKNLEQFSYIISHNLRSPVANILGFSGLLEDETLEESMKKEVISGISTAVHKLDGVIKDLSEIINQRRLLNENKEIVNFAQLVEDIHLEVEATLKKEKGSIVYDFSEVPEMLTIKSYMHSIFFNLISNSLKYKQPNIAPVIELKSYKLNNRIMLTFKDNGMGIDLKNKAEHVFGLYKRFHTDKAEGKGMGLYMVKTQVESIGGQISLTSEINIGTEFKIEFTP